MPTESLRPSVLVTGAGGFVGGALVRGLVARGLPVLAGVRTASSPLPTDVGAVVLGDLHEVGLGVADLPSLSGIDVVVHCAARVHQMKEHGASAAAYDAVNREASLRLARAAAAAGARRFVFLSSIKVNGERTERGSPFTADGPATPADAYGRSKHAAELGLARIAAETGMELVVVRPPLVYGPGVKANFRSMLSWIARGWPLPFGSIDNRRSLVFIDNLVDLLCVAVTHPKAAGRTFLSSDGADLSTTALLHRCARAMNLPARLVPVPPRWLRAAAFVTGRGAVADKLLNSLELDIGPTRRLLDWTPPVNINEGLSLTARSFLREVSHGQRDDNPR